VLPFTFSHFWDETVFLQHAKVMLNDRSNYDEFIHRPPLLSAMYAVRFALWDSIYMANIVQGIVTSLAVLFVFLYARSVFGTATALFAAAMLAFMPYVVEASHNLLTDGPALTLMLAAMWLFQKQDMRFSLLSGVAYSLAIQTRLARRVGVKRQDLQYLLWK
jgi:4-amino-4-deoxy-L-arabinose transferase-like glycosyltransferase